MIPKAGRALTAEAGLVALVLRALLLAKDRLDQLGAHFEKGLRQLLAEKGVPHRFNRVGSMFCLFFTDREIVNVNDVMKQDLEFFKKFFWGCLDKGIYLAPSPYETGFISLAHTEADLDDTLSVFDEVLGSI